MMQFSTTAPGPGQYFFTRLRPYLAALLLLLSAPLAHAQAPGWQTAMNVGGSDATVTAITTDAAGNVYLTGFFAGTATFGSTVLTEAGNNYDTFVAKWQPSLSRFAWAKQAGGPQGGTIATSISVVGTSVYLAGYFGGAATFGATAITRNGSFNDGFVAKLTDGGTTANFVWAQRVGGTLNDAVKAIVASGPNVYLAGYCTGYSTFGSLVLNNVSGGTDGFVAKLTDAGATATFTWVQPLGGPMSDEVTALAVSGTSVYATGEFSSTANFGSTNLTSAGLGDVFVAKLVDGGAASTVVWAQQGGGTSVDHANALTVQGGNVYVAGDFNGTANYGATSLVSAGGLDVVVAKLVDAGANGSVAWAQRAGGSGDDSANALAVTPTALFATGGFDTAARFGSTDLAGGAYEVFVTKLTDNGLTGGFAWAQSAGGTSYDNGYALACTTSGQGYVCGGISPPASFGSVLLTNSASNVISFLATFQDATGLATMPAGPLVGTSLYPNPAHATATVQLPPVPGASAATLSVIDALGRVVRTATVPLPAAGLSHELALTGLPAGLYAVRVAAGDRSATHRLVVE